MTQRPPTSGAMGNTYGRPPSSRDIVPGTGMRSSYGFNGAVGASISTNVVGEIQHRPAVQNGMKGMTSGKPGTSGPGRNVKDRSYYMGLLRQKIGELTAELERLKTQEDSVSKGQAMTAQLSQSIKKVQEDINRMKSALSDLNFTLEKVGSTPGYDHEAAAQECQHFRQQNEQQKKENDKIFLKVKEEEKQCRNLENTLQHQIAVLDQRLSVDVEKAETYKRLRDENFGVMDQVNAAKSEINQLTERYDELLKELKKDPEKHRASEVQKEILRKRRLKAQLEAECSVSIEQERQNLLQAVRSTTSEIEAIMRQTDETREELERRQESLAKVDSDLNEYQGENVKRYVELQEKDKEMQEFIDKFSLQEREEQANLQANEQRVIALLEQMSRNLQYKDDLSKETNASTRLQAMRDELDVKGKQTDASMSTYERLLQELEARKTELEKVASLDEKLSVELTSMTQRIEEQQSEIQRFSDIESLQREIETNKKSLQERRVVLLKRRDAVRQHITLLNSLCDQKKEELTQSDIHDGLTKQEQRMRVTLQTHFQLDDFVRTKERETAYLPLKAEGLRMVDELNNALKEQRRNELQQGTTNSAGVMGVTMSANGMGGTMNMAGGNQTLRL